MKNEGLADVAAANPEEQRNLLRMGELPIGLPDVGQPKTDVTVESPRSQVVAPPAPAPTQTPPGGGMPYQGTPLP